ncbi:MAG: hypothetical protein K9I94_13975 [Bacteroidales bacterium]|nr:hypothetical protein [Bacteroidales bacterium]
MSRIVKKVTQLLVSIIFMYGVYIVTHGHLTPGGGFAGGAIIVGAFALIILAYGSDALKLHKEEAGSSASESLSILMVLILAVIGFFVGGMVFFNNYLPTGVVGELISAGTVPLYNIFIGMEVAAALLTIFIALVIFKEESK